MNKTRETLNDVKLWLLDRLHSNTKQQLTDSDFDFQGKTAMMLLSLTNFSPYICQAKDLDGMFHSVKKRQLMSPFNMNYN